MPQVYPRTSLAQAVVAVQGGILEQYVVDPAGWAPACVPAADTGWARTGPATRAKAAAVTADSHENLLVIRTLRSPVTPQPG
jgi:hypothetical protein